MGVREWVKRRQSLAAVGAVVMIAGAAVAIFIQARDPDAGSGLAFFTTDDGKTLFTDRITRLAPFDKDGKPACRAHVFECDGKRFVGYLSRYTPEAMKALEEAKASRGTGKPPPNVHLLATAGTAGLQVKRPGDPYWVSGADMARATAIRVVRCPDGGTPEEVDP